MKIGFKKTNLTHTRTKYSKVWKQQKYLPSKTLFITQIQKISTDEDDTEGKEIIVKVTSLKPMKS